MDVDLAPRRLRVLPSWLLGQASLRARREVSASFTAVGAHRTHYAVLAALDELGPQSQADLGRRCDIDRSDMHALVGELARADLLTSGPDPADRRRHVVAVTKQGRRRLRELDRRVASAQQALLAPLSPAEQAQLVGLLDRLVSFDGDGDGDGSEDGVDG